MLTNKERDLMKTIGFICPKCSSINCFILDNNLTLSDLNSNWFKCTFCLNISDKNEWNKINTPKKIIYYQNIELN